MTTTTKILLTSLVAATACSVTAYAKNDKKEAKKAMLEEFDTDKDGELSKDEKKAMKKAQKAEAKEAGDKDAPKDDVKKEEAKEDDAKKDKKEK